MDGVLPPLTSRQSKSLRLDVFRGLAAIFMVANHTGYELLGQLAGVPGWPAFAVFVASAAPALFFFASGVGAGMSGGAPESAGSVLRKVVLLLLADAFMSWRNGGLWGFDFFGFAAVIVVVLAALRWSRLPRVSAAVLLLGVVLLRFVVGPLLKGALGSNPVFEFVVGVGTLPGVSYPLCPWLAFPLAGFLVGRLDPDALPARELIAAASLAILACLCGGVLASNGAVLFRWGSVSVAYFACAIGIVATAWVVAAALVAGPAWGSEFLKLRGPASLFVVPLHFALMALLPDMLSLPIDGGPWVAVTAATCVVVLMLSRGLVAGVAARVPAPAREADLLVIVAIAGIAVAARLWTSGVARVEIECAAQVAIGLLLASGRRGPVSSTRASLSEALEKTRRTALPR